MPAAGEQGIIRGKIFEGHACSRVGGGRGWAAAAAQVAPPRQARFGGCRPCLAAAPPPRPAKLQRCSPDASAPIKSENEMSNVTTRPGARHAQQPAASSKSASPSAPKPSSEKLTRSLHGAAAAAPAAAAAAAAAAAGNARVAATSAAALIAVPSAISPLVVPLLPAPGFSSRLATGSGAYPAARGSPPPQPPLPCAWRCRRVGPSSALSSSKKHMRARGTCRQACEGGRSQSRHQQDGPASNSSLRPRLLSAAPAQVLPTAPPTAKQGGVSTCRHAPKRASRGGA